MIKVAHRVHVRVVTPGKLDQFIWRSIYRDGGGHHYICWMSSGRGIVHYYETDQQWVYHGEPYVNKSKR